ncbi:MAG: oligopeptide/dipeptide ABC transporter ATP-binding protein [Hyphomicrobiaceae bacterium]|jgi:oligopeptide/dipeptide ABC transporter ATP-binding protein
MAAMLTVRDLVVGFDTHSGFLTAVDGVGFSVDAGESVAIVGESGCGKSVTALSIMRLLPVPPAKIMSGTIEFDGRNLLELSEREMRDVRGNDAAMIFQEPMTSLNPVLTVGFQIAEALRVHRSLSKREAAAEAVRMLELVEMPDPEDRVHSYPHELSGGMRQRVMIAMALSCEPRLLIADEPTTALDVTIQAQVLELLASLKKRLGMALLLITHDLGVVAEHTERVVVMYAGRVVETGPVAQVFETPLHPYTQGLLRSVPRLGGERGELATIPGTVPALDALPSGCRFRDRCPLAEAECAEKDPALHDFGNGRSAACLVSARNQGLGS